MSAEKAAKSEATLGELIAEVAKCAARVEFARLSNQSDQRQEPSLTAVQDLAEAVDALDLAIDTAPADLSGGGADQGTRLKALRRLKDILEKGIPLGSEKFDREAAHDRTKA